MNPSIKTLLQLKERKHDIACALIFNLKDWLPQANNVESAIDILGLDPNDYFQDEQYATHDAIEIQQKWIAVQIEEQAQAIMNELYRNSDITLMEWENKHEG